MVLPAWPAGDLAPVCVSWAARSPYVAAVMRSVQWVNAGQAVGLLDAQAPALADGVMAVKQEWQAIHAEEVDKQRRKAARDGVR